MATRSMPCSSIYLSCVLSSDGSLKPEIHLCILKTHEVFDKLENRAWENHGIIKKTKLNIYKSCVLTALLSSSEIGTEHKDISNCFIVFIFKMFLRHTEHQVAK